jgi:hypothetical protein
MSGNTTAVDEQIRQLVQEYPIVAGMVARVIEKRVKTNYQGFRQDE